MLTIVMAVVLLPAIPKLNANAVTKYNLWVLDRQVTSANCNNILGNGSARYDVSTKTLHIKKNVVDYSNNSSFDSNYPFIRSYINGLTISNSDFTHASGAVTFSLGSQIWGFQLYADTTITGKGGRLFIDGHHTIDVYGNSTLTIKDTEVVLNHQVCYFNNAMGICGNGENTKLRIVHSRMWPGSNPYDYNTASICGFKRGIELEDSYLPESCKIEYVTNSAIPSGYTVLKSDGSICKDLYIGPIEKMTIFALKNKIGQIVDNYAAGKITEDEAVRQLMYLKDEIDKGRIVIVSFIPVNVEIAGKPINIGKTRSNEELVPIDSITTDISVAGLNGEVINKSGSGLRPGNEIVLSDSVMVRLYLALYAEGSITRTKTIDNLYNIVTKGILTNNIITRP